MDTSKLTKQQLLQLRLHNAYARTETVREQMGAEFDPELEKRLDFEELLSWSAEQSARETLARGPWKPSAKPLPPFWTRL